MPSSACKSTRPPRASRKGIGVAPIVRPPAGNGKIIGSPPLALLGTAGAATAVSVLVLCSLCLCMGVWLFGLTSHVEGGKASPGSASRGVHSQPRRHREPHRLPGLLARGGASWRLCARALDEMGGEVGGSSAKLFWASGASVRIFIYYPHHPPHHHRDQEYTPIPPLQRGAAPPAGEPVPVHTGSYNSFAGCGLARSLRTADVLPFRPAARLASTLVRAGAANGRLSCCV